MERGWEQRHLGPGDRPWTISGAPERTWGENYPRRCHNFQRTLRGKTCGTLAVQPLFLHILSTSKLQPKMPHSESKWRQNVKPCAQTCEMLSLPPRNTVNEPAESLHLVKDFFQVASGSHCSLMRFYRGCSGKYPVLDFR